MKIYIAIFSSALLCIGSCSKSHNEVALRNTISQCLEALQKDDIDKLYQFELPEFKERISLEEYKAHNLLELVDSILALNYTIKDIRYQSDTATIITEIHFLESDSTVTDSFKAVFVGGAWYIPIFSSDLNQ